MYINLYIGKECKHMHKIKKCMENNTIELKTK